MLEFESRIWVRPLSAADEALYCELYTDAQAMQFIGPPLSARRAMRNFRKYIRSSRRPAVTTLLLAMIEKSTGQAVGIGAIQQLDERGRRAEAGMMFKPAVHARGFAKEVLPALITQAFTLLPIDEISAQAAADHAVVERLLTSVGFARRCGTTGDECPAKYTWSAGRESWFARQPPTDGRPTAH
jgi:RimJ/RimL family protein N-acetyltransferase